MKIKSDIVINLTCKMPKEKLENTKQLYSTKSNFLLLVEYVSQFNEIYEFVKLNDKLAS